MNAKRLFWGAILLAGLTLPVGAAASAAGPRVVRITLEGTVDPLAARYVERSVAQATGAAAILVRIDTPGGLDSSMRKIINALEGSKVPVVCWVGPSGARAASAGAIVMMGCPVSAMAPGTNIGAAHPVGLTGDILAEKVTNDAAAYARSLAQTWGHDPVFAEKMVRDSISITAKEALARNVIDLIANSEAELLRVIDGKPTQDPNSGGVFHTAGVAIESSHMTLMESILHRVVDPNLAFLLFVFGIAGLVFEVVHPGISIPGILGGLSFITSLVILGMLPVNIAGLVLLAAAIGFFVVEAHAPGLGVPGALGMVSLVLGGLFMFDASVPNAHVSIGIIIGTAVAVALLFGVVVRAVFKARRSPHTHEHPREMIGAEGVVERALAPTGVVRARGESWTAESSTEIPAGAHVRVTGVRGLTLEVAPLDVASEPQGGTS